MHLINFVVLATLLHLEQMLGNNIFMLMLNRNADMNVQRPADSTTRRLEFWHLFGIDYDFSDGAKGTFPKFILFESTSNRQENFPLEKYNPLSSRKSPDFKTEKIKLLPLSLYSLLKSNLFTFLNLSASAGGSFFFTILGHKLEYFLFISSYVFRICSISFLWISIFIFDMFFIFN